MNSPTFYYGRALVSLCLLTIFLAACESQSNQPAPAAKPTASNAATPAPAPVKPERVTIETSDGVKIIGDYYAAADGRAPAIVALPMFSATRATYAQFAAHMVKLGFAVL